ncbi:MAG: ComF family protein, partial [Bacteroidota bacterium]
PQIGQYLGQLMAEHLEGPKLWTDVEAIVPIPLHWTKQIQRGYNQSKQIALGISQVTGIPVREDLLIRNRKTQSQAKKSGAKRWTNVSGAFQAALHLPSRILLVDDVITTGATIVAAAQAFEDRVDALSITSVALTRRN